MPRRIEADSSTHFGERNRQIGIILTEARQQSSFTQEKCAQFIGTTRRRYGLIERGEVPVRAVELEVLMRVLNIPAQMIWGELIPINVSRQVIVYAQPGESLQLVVQVQE